MSDGLVQPPSHSKTFNPPQSDSPEGAFHVGTSWFVIVAPYVSWFNELVDYRVLAGANGREIFGASFPSAHLR